MYQILLLLFKACQYSQRRVLYLLLNWVVIQHPSTWLKYTEIRILITNSFIIVVELQTIPLWWPVLSELFSLSLRFQTEFITEPPVINLRPTTFYFSRYPFISILVLYNKQNWQVRFSNLVMVFGLVSQSVTHSLTAKVPNILLLKQKGKHPSQLSVGRQYYSQIQSSTYPDCSFRQHLPCLFVLR